MRQPLFAQAWRTLAGHRHGGLVSANFFRMWKSGAHTAVMRVSHNRQGHPQIRKPKRRAFVFRRLTGHRAPPIQQGVCSGKSLTAADASA